MKIPYFKQETCWTCGAACIRMILASIGIKKTEKQIIRLLKTNKIKGTWHKYIPELAEKYKLDYIIERNGKISDLRRYSKRQWIVVVCFTYEGESHYSIIKKINWHSIYLLDPACCPKHRYYIPKFEKIWKDSEENKWFAAIKKA